MDEWTLIQEIASNATNWCCNGTWNSNRCEHNIDDVCNAICGFLKTVW